MIVSLKPLTISAVKYQSENNIIRNYLLDYSCELEEKKEYDKLLNYISDLAQLETNKYLGYLSSIRMENILQNIAIELSVNNKYVEKPKTHNKRKVIHLATEIYSVGGHSRVIKDWMKNDIDSDSHLIITNQLPNNNLTETELDFNGKITFIEGKSLKERAENLRTYVLSNFFDVLINHQHMHDVIPSIALWDIINQNDRISIMYNHANFHFSLGNLIANKRINFSSGDIEISKSFRYPVEDVHLPFVFEKEKYFEKSEVKNNALKSGLNITNEKVLLSIASSYKYAPYKEVNFLKEWNEFLQNNTDIVLIVIGCDEYTFLKYVPNEQLQQNMKLIGVTSEIHDYYSIADYMVDVYPLQTGLGTYEGLLYKAPPFIPYFENPMVHGVKANSLYPEGLLKLLKYDSKDSYFKFIKNEMVNKNYIFESKFIIDDFVNKHCFGETWREKLYKIYTQPPISTTFLFKESKLFNNSKNSINWYNYSNSDTYCANALYLIEKYRIKFNIKIALIFLKLCLLKTPLFSRYKYLKLLFNYK